jgi:hypothetical protein
MILSLTVSTGPKSLFNQSLLIFDSPSVADKEQCYFYFHLVGINTQICRSSISNPAGDKKKPARIPLYNDF